MFLHVAHVSILRAGKENGYSDVASILGPACGKAHRVGTIRVQGTLFALYRLQVAVQGRRHQVMLPHLFVFVDGCFVDHAAWAATKTS